MTLPLRYLVGSLTSTHTASAMSSGVATLPSGFLPARSRHKASSLLRIESHSGVRTGPGETTLTRIPYRGRDLASAFAIAITPAVAADRRGIPDRDARCPRW